MVKDITPKGYPEAILKGDVLAELFEAVCARLRGLLPEASFAHTILPPHPTQGTWQKIIKNGATVAVGFGGWRGNDRAGASFTGTVSFPVGILLTQVKSEALYQGTGQLRGMGIMGVMAAIAGGMHNWTVPGIGTCCVRNLNIPETAEWFNERSALIVAELVFDNVELGNSETLALLDDFIKQTNQIETLAEQEKKNG